MALSTDREVADRSEGGALVRRRRIGLIVTGSLLVGFVASVILVVVLFGGAQEHVIMGTALIGWALGWAMLAILSTRWTDQPQRWAAVPAALMALAGAGLLIFQPDANAFNALGWIWPPALIALAIWMAIQARRNLRSLTRGLLLYPLLGALVITGVGGSYETIQEQVDRSSAAMLGHLVDVGGRRLYIHCAGTGSPTVVLISGLGETSAYWGGWIEPAVAAHTTVCAFDRAGQGRSDPPPNPQDGAAIASDLHTLLEDAQIAGPYVVAAHSTGGVYARIFAAHYPDQVAGMVLLDSQPNEAMSGGLPDYPSQYSALRRATALFPPLARVGLFRLVYQLGGDALPPAARDAERTDTTTGGLMRIQRDEFAMLPQTLKEAAALTSLGDKPLVVITALKEAERGWPALQDKMATLSTNSVHRVLPDIKHADVIHSQVGGEASARGILDVVNYLRNGTPLPKSSA
ncbi:MAG TPA: alpha/beta hydrolase [Candidatus Dormibacteraeota bacterium]|nr:alpha/beta hydrolase [Candidatus Dormibacteraeota bacterium]